MMRTAMSWWAFVLWAWLSASVASAQSGDPPIVHVVREGETLASIAQQYYGDPKRESVLVAENGLTAEGGATIVVGLRLVIPTVHYYRVEKGDSWRSLAARFYGDASRQWAIMRANDGRPGRIPDAGAQLLVPYPVRHTVGPNETLPGVAELYYGGRRVRIVRSFNGLRGARLERGQILLIPLDDLTLSDEGRERVEEATGREHDTGDARQVQADIESKLPLLREHVKHGRFEEAVALGNWLLGRGAITGNQELTIQRELGTAYVALERRDLAIEAFSRALARQPDLELDSAKTSPSVMEAFQRARSAK